MSLEKRITKAMERFKVTQGENAGEKFKLISWQKKFILKVFGDDKVDTAGLTIARANGKTTFLAAITALAVDGPLESPRAEVIVVASSFQQACILFRHTLSFLGKRKHLRVIQNSHLCSIENKNSGVLLKVIGSDPQRAHGLAPKIVICDEPGQWKEGTGESMYSALITSLGKIPGGKFIAIGTKPADENHWFNILLKSEADFSMDFSLGKDDDVSKKRLWKKANPSLPYFKTLKQRLDKEFKQALLNSHTMQMFRSLRLNQGVSDICENLVIDLDAWKLSLTKDLPERDGELIIGLDFGGSTSMSAAAAYWPKTGRLETICFFSEIPSIEERQKNDGVDKLYSKMIERGELELLGSRVVPLSEMLKKVFEKFGKPSVLVSDRFRKSEFLDGLDEARCPKSAKVVFRGLGFRDGHEDIISFRKACLSEKIKTLNSLSLTSALHTARVVHDPAGNIKMTRASEGRRRSRSRDDVLVATILSTAVGYRLMQTQKEKKPTKLTVI